MIKLLCGDCLEVMKGLPDASVDAVVTDPPAGIAFMGKEWDHHKGGRREWIAWLAERMAEAYRIAKPGTYALVWALPRTSHWTATAVEDAGWTIRDRVTHLFGTGFPKAKSCLKPAAEDWWLAYKPGGKMSPLQIDACRIAGEVPSVTQGASSRIYGNGKGAFPEGLRESQPHSSGRWPANVVLDEEAAAMLDEMSGERPGDRPNRKPRVQQVEPGSNGKTMNSGWRLEGTEGFADSGGASRFFATFPGESEPRFTYTAKASRSDRGPDNTHPTVKSHNLMRWLCRLITPPGGTVLDPFAGSGSTADAADAEGFDFIGIEREQAYVSIAEGRIEAVRASLPLLRDQIG